MPAGGNLAAIAAKPDFPVPHHPHYATAQVRAADGTRQAALIVTTAMTGFDLRYGPESDADKASFDTFWNDNQGSYSGFTWVNPIDSVTYNVFFDPETGYHPRKVSANTWEWDVRLVFRKP